MSRLNVLGGLVRLMMPAGVISALYAGRLAEGEGRRSDPKAQALRDLVATVRGPEPVYDVATSREQLAGVVERFDQPGPEGVRRTEEELPGAEGFRAARVYNPEGAKPARTLLYFHGGGWIQGSIDTHDALCAKLCAGAGIRVISYDYRLAPEAPFPAAPDDVLAAYLGLVSGGLDLSADPAQLVVGGDSAGGNLAAGLMHDLRAGDHPLPKGQLLIYPAVDGRMSSGSMQALDLSTEDQELSRGPAAGADPRGRARPALGRRAEPCPGAARGGGRGRAAGISRPGARVPQPDEGATRGPRGDRRRGGLAARRLRGCPRDAGGGERMTLRGRCLCGACRFRVEGEASAASACHCTTCRKTSGHVRASARAPEESVTIEGAGDLVRGLGTRRAWILPGLRRLDVLARPRRGDGELRARLPGR